MSDKKARIRIAGNTNEPCLVTLRDKGYVIRVWAMQGDDLYQWDAEKDGNEFSATSPQELLGLIAMWEHRGNHWGRGPNDPDPRLYDTLTRAAKIYDSDGNEVDEG